MVTQLFTKIKFSPINHKNGLCDIIWVINSVSVLTYRCNKVIFQPSLEIWPPKCLPKPFHIYDCLTNSLLELGMSTHFWIKYRLFDISNSQGIFSSPYANVKYYFSLIDYPKIPVLLNFKVIFNTCNPTIEEKLTIYESEHEGYSIHII